MIKNLCCTVLFLASATFFGQVGIETKEVSPSAIVELKTDHLPAGSKKGLLGPRVALRNNIDQTSIPSPANGVIVYNTANAGAYPNQVFANRYYYWDGSIWEDFGITKNLENFLAIRMFSLNSSRTQSFSYIVNTPSNPTYDNPSNNINNTSNTNGGIVVDFMSQEVVVDVGGIASLGTNFIDIKMSGLYEISGYVNYNPEQPVLTVSTWRGSFLNLKIQIQRTGTTSWIDFIGSRSAWGIYASRLLKTANLVSTPLYLNKGDKIRLVVQNPFGGNDTSATHGGNSGEANPRITTSYATPISKSLTLTLLDYDLATE